MVFQAIVDVFWVVCIEELAMLEGVVLQPVSVEGVGGVHSVVAEVSVFFQVDGFPLVGCCAWHLVEIDSRGGEDGSVGIRPDRQSKATRPSPQQRRMRRSTMFIGKPQRAEVLP